jgi:hypothetical protein
VTVRTTRSRALTRLRERLVAMDQVDQRPASGVTRIGPAGYPAPVAAVAPRISA